MTPKPRHALVTMGSPRFREVRTPSVDVVSAWFPPNARLTSHTHARAVFGVMLDGAFRTRIASREVDYLPAGAWTEPAEERHANVASARGARVLILQPTAGSTVSDVCRSLLDEIVYVRSFDLKADAARIEGECAGSDDLSPLVVEGTALAMLARAARVQRRRRTHDRSPRWLGAVVDYLHAHAFDRINLGTLASTVGVHPSRLAHEFRARFDTTPGDYVRRLRLEWAASCLRASDGGGIAEIAIRAGFYDQSHFSRTFRRHFGLTPAEWRRRQSRT
jgi:AraC family transcriptional regulator